MHNSTIRALLLGDAHVGKSSIITALIKEAFVPLPENSCLPPVTIPAEAFGSSSSFNLTTVICDTSSDPSSAVYLENELRKSDVVIIVYAVDDAHSFERIALYWLPYIRSQGSNLPVVLVGNKIDLRADSANGPLSNQALEAEIFPVMQAWKEIETCVECSAKTCTNIAEIFYFAQRAVLYPTAPLYDSREHALKPACLHALRRIFKLCDSDKDGILNDSELNAFQRKCFSSPLQQSELEGIKSVVWQISPDTIRDDGLTEEGFLTLHTIFIQKGRLETTWTVLRKFGYGEDLALKESFLYPKFDVASDCAVELTPAGLEFFADIFNLHDKDKDGALSPEELNDLFSTSPGNPWVRDGFPATTVTNDQGNVTLQGWLAQWAMTTLLNHRITLAYLAYLGFQSSSQPPISTTTALQITSSRKAERKAGKSKRQVMTALLLGAAGSGKSTLMRSFVGKNVKNIPYEPTSRQSCVVNSVEIGGVEKYLVLMEFGREEPEILRSPKRLSAIDVIVYVYDSADTNSFSYISNLRQQHKLDHIPSVFVASKSDCDLAVQRHEVQPDVYCRRLQLRPPVACNWRQTAVLWQVICSAGIRPNSAIPGGVAKQSSMVVPLAVVSAIGVTAVSTALFYYRSQLLRKWWSMFRAPMAGKEWL